VEQEVLQLGSSKEVLVRGVTYVIDTAASSIPTKHPLMLDPREAAQSAS
jgi:hypothetical protein